MPLAVRSQVYFSSKNISANGRKDRTGYARKGGAREVWAERCAEHSAGVGGCSARRKRLKTVRRLLKKLSSSCSQKCRKMKILVISSAALVSATMVSEVIPLSRIGISSEGFGGNPNCSSKLEKPKKALPNRHNTNTALTLWSSLAGKIPLAVVK